MEWVVVVLLRYYEGGSLANVGRALGVSEDTARKRVATALSHLAGFFRRRGCKTLTVAGAAALLESTAGSTPATVAAAVFQAAAQASPPAALGLTALLGRVASMSHAQVVVACLVLLAVPIGWQWHQFHEFSRQTVATRSRIEALRDESERAASELDAWAEKGTRLERRRKLQSLVLKPENLNALENAKRRFRDLLADANDAWPEDLPLVRIPKSVLHDLHVAPPLTSPGVIRPAMAHTYYDTAGLAVTNEDRAGKRSIALFDPLQRPVSVEIRDAGNNNALLWCQTTAYSADFNSVTVTTGTGASAIRNTTFTDTLGDSVLEQSFPATGTTNFSRSVFDAAGNCMEQWDELGQVTTYTYDGLNRLSGKRLPDLAQISYSYNPEGSIAAMTMPNHMVWSASYNQANQRTGEWLSNGAQVTRQFTNHYFLSGPYAGLRRQTVDQGRSIKTTFSYDAFLRLSGSSASGPLPEHDLSTVLGYDRQNRLTNYLQSSGVNPTTEIRQAYDGYGQLTNEQVAVYGLFTNSIAQSWSAAGRRNGLITDTARFDYVYRPDGRLAQVSAFGSTYGSYSYGANGLLDGRSNPWRTVSVLQRDGRGLPLSVSSSVGGAIALVETMTWRTNGTLGSYNATRSGSGAWNESRSLGYNARNQLTGESFGLSNNASASAAYAFDATKLGVLTSMILSGGSTNVWTAGAASPDGFGRIQQETLYQGSTMVRASGAAPGAQQVRGTLDGNSLGALTYDPSSPDGRWSVDLNLTNASHTLSVSAVHPSGRYTNTASTSFTVVGSDALSDSYDSAGYVVGRTMASGAQTLHWDAAGRLVSISQRNAQASGYDWSAVYDALGRRLYSTWVPVSNSVALSGQLVSQSSLFDPQVEFQEIAVSLNGVRTWKVYGPDLDGSYGSAQGLGGLEATRQEGASQPLPVLQDHFGNVLATINPQSGSVTWSSTRLSGYGPALGYAAPIFSPSLTLADASVWRGKRIDPSGYYWLGARYYDPVAGRFLSPDPAGHEAAYDLYSFCGGDPINQFDPTGRFGKEMFQGIQNYKDDVFGDSIVQQMHRQDQILSASSQLVNMVPIIGAGKMFLEMNTMRDMFTGERQDQNQYLQALGIVLNALPVLTEGMSLANEAGVMPSAGWQTESSSALKAELSATRTELAGSGGTLTGSTGAGKGVVMNVNAAESPVALESACFVAGTRVAAEKGFEEIQAIKSGELVWSRNPTSGDWELKPVVRTFTHDYQGDIITLKVGGSVIESTGNHPFWVVEGEDLENRPAGGDVPVEAPSGRQSGRWVAARDLRGGDILLDRANEPVLVGERSARVEHATVYNIEVVGNHNYAVSEQSVLVHNKPARYGSLSSEEVYGTYGDAAAEGGVPSALRAGQLAEGPALDAIGSGGKVVFTPTAEQINSAAFKVIVGDARYTASGAPVSTIFDGSTAAGLAEIKSGSSMLNSTYQLRLQTYGALVNNQPLTIFTSRPINPTFGDWLTRWGVSVKPMP